jgi:hypothetical protein
MARKPVIPRARRPKVNDNIKAARNAEREKTARENRENRKDLRARNAGKAPTPSGGNKAPGIKWRDIESPNNKTSNAKPGTTKASPPPTSGGSSGPRDITSLDKSPVKKKVPTPSQVSSWATRTGLTKARVLSLLSRGAGAVALTADTVAAIKYLESKVPEKNPKTVDPRIAKTKRANEAGDRARAEAIANNASPREANQARAAEMKKRRSVSSVKAREVKANEPKETKASNRVVPDPVPRKRPAKAAASNIGSSTGSSKKAPVPSKRPSKGTTAKELYNLGKDAEKKVEVNKAVTEAKKKSRIVQEYDYPGDKY